MPTVDRRPSLIRYLTSEGRFPFAVKADGFETGWSHGGRGGLRLPAPFARGQVTGRLGLSEAHKAWLRENGGALGRVVFISERGKSSHPDEVLVVMTARTFTEVTSTLYNQEGGGS